MRCSPSKFILGTNKITELTEQWARDHKQEQGWPNNRHTGMEGLHPGWMMAFPWSHRRKLVLGPSSPVSSNPTPGSRDHMHLWETAHIQCGWMTGYSGEGPGTFPALLLWEKANRQHVQLYVGNQAQQTPAGGSSCVSQGLDLCFKWKLSDDKREEKQEGHRFMASMFKRCKNKDLMSTY